ncbi:MAG: hypothetical protein SX243_06020 [Acidobacteriota bacterium]|nr:hypothetical protein [Acidobacteriota bacterium]
MSAHPLVEQVRSGSSRELQLMAASGLLPVEPHELIPLQVDLARCPDTEIAEVAARSLRELDGKVLSSFLAEDASPRELGYFALEASEHRVLETILRRRDAPPELLVAVAPSLEEDLQEVLLLRQDIIVEHPQILDALTSNPNLSRYSSRRIKEYRQHLLPKEAPEKPKEKPGKIEEATDEEVKEALDAARAERPEGVDEEVEETTGLTDAQIRSLPTPVRMKLTRGASRSLRGLLLKDPISVVALAAYHNNNFSDQEIEQACLGRNTHEDVLAAISRDRQFVTRYAIVLALVKNPRAPVGNVVRLMPRLSVRDLRDIRKDRNVPDPVRKTADRLYTIKVS